MRLRSKHSCGWSSTRNDQIIWVLPSVVLVLVALCTVLIKVRSVNNNVHLSMIFYAHIEHISTQTTHTKHHMERETTPTTTTQHHPMHMNKKHNEFKCVQH